MMDGGGRGGEENSTGNEGREGYRRARRKGGERVQGTEEARSRKGGNEIRAGARGGGESRRRRHLVDGIRGGRNYYVK